MLDFRLEYLNDAVDYFILVESTLTHSGKPKPLYFQDNKTRYSKYLHKIVHVVVYDMIRNPIIRMSKQSQINRNWDREIYQRKCISKGINILNLEDSDRILISDLDEIPNRNILKNEYDYEVYALKQELYYYTLNYRADSFWTLARMLTYKSYKFYDKNPQFIRSKLLELPVIDNGGWHFSYFGSIDFIVNKLRNFCHSDWFENLNYQQIKEKIDKGEVILSTHQFHIFKFIPVTENTNLPDNYEKLLTLTK